MDLYSSGEDLVVKTRKPYTVTKQRERWTEEEHNRFLGALKLYGRAWQRIEEHIGTKTAVQIRSHAQKFFSKLEKEAIVKGVPIGHALDIDIPPPRPKRKPNNPYPRKSGAPTPEAAVKIDNTPSLCSIFSSCRSKPTMALEKESGEEANDEKSDDSHHKHQAVPRPFESPGDAPKKMRAFTQYVQLSTETSNVDVAGTSQITVEAGEPNSLHCRNILESSVDETGPNTAPVMPVGAEARHCTNTSRPSNQPFSGYHYPPIGSFLHVSSMFSSLVVSALLQNPASYAAAAGYAATLWPCKGGGPPSTAPPSMAEIATATVAAATAWWASHGLLTMHPKQQVVRSSESEANRSVIEVPAKNANTEAKQATKNEKTEKPFDRSPCYSNTASGSDAAAEKKSEDHIKHTKAGDFFEDLFTRRCKTTSNNINDYWKEVSEEGQLAFQALFSRDVLPQSFSPPPDDANKKGEKTVSGEEDGEAKVENDNASTTNVNIKTGFLNMGLGLELGLAKLKPRRTGFKPYKRCSMEGRESRVSTHNPDEERGPKRRCIGEAST